MMFEERASKSMLKTEQPTNLFLLFLVSRSHFTKKFMQISKH
jgi:hypothetical protein